MRYASVQPSTGVMQKSLPEARYSGVPVQIDTMPIGRRHNCRGSRMEDWIMNRKSYRCQPGRRYILDTNDISSMCSRITITKKRCRDASLWELMKSMLQDDTIRIIRGTRVIA